MFVCNVNKLISAYISTLQGAVFNTGSELALQHQACGARHISPVTNWTSRYERCRNTSGLHLSGPADPDERSSQVLLEIVSLERKSTFFSLQPPPKSSR